jgi:orotidine-5'-phosphate decarboxylase
MSVDVRPSSLPSAAADRPLTYCDRLGARVAEVGNWLCLGVDPDPQSLPDGFPRDVRGVERYARLLLDEGLRHAAAIKINLAFFEAFGSAGIAALERVRARIPANIPFIADAKRGDIGVTSARQAVALFETLGADAITVNPYLGRDAIAPHLDRPGAFVYVVCRTSNPGAGELQDMTVGSPPGEPLYVHVARRAAAWAAGADNVGLVVGATAPVELGLLREAAPSLPFLVPGLGAQGGDIEAVRRHGPATSGPAAATHGGGLVVNVSRGIAEEGRGAPDEGAARKAVAGAVARWAALLQC